jgi:DNA-directed RNA polymerase I and III subunit RPAC1
VRGCLGRASLLCPPANKSPPPTHTHPPTHNQQCIQLEAHASKGIGQEHAKWSPVATAWYRLQPEVVLLQPLAGPDAAQLVAEVPGLFTLDASGRLVVGAARQHEQQLEKVRVCKGGWLCATLLRSSPVARTTLLTAHNAPTAPTL